MFERVPPRLVPLSPAQHAAEEMSDAVRSCLELRCTMYRQALDRVLTSSEAVSEAAGLVIRTLNSGNRVFAAGNGGSAAQAQHFAAELVGRFKLDRAPFAALALTGDMSTLTAVANDYGYDEVFSRQLLALGCPGDLLVAFSTSGESTNLIRAASAARQIGMAVVAIVGAPDSSLYRLADRTISVQAGDTPSIQELHLLLTHVLCDVTETALTGAGPRT